uniref:Uncharacterized protein n=1 Tax=Arundo donax TaxID=35708 RepID=A0A0A9FY73_ARUDO
MYQCWLNLYNFVRCCQDGFLEVRTRRDAHGAHVVDLHSHCQCLFAYCLISCYCCAVQVVLYCFMYELTSCWLANAFSRLTCCKLMRR